MSRLLASFLAAAALLLVGCDPRDLPSTLDAGPSVVILVQPGYDACTLDGRAMDEMAVRAELLRLVDGDRPSSSRMAGSRVRVRLVAAPGADWSRLDTLTQYCQSIGINRIELPSNR